MSEFAVYPSLNNRVVIITGGASGIGASMVASFCEQKARVHFLDIDDAASQALVEDMRGRGWPAPQAHHCDIRDIDRLREIIEAIGGAEAGIDVLVNNAANDQRHKFEDVTLEYWDERMALNLRHQFFAAQAVLPAMRQKGGGAIINMGSSSWRLGVDAMPCYTTAKAGIEGLTRSLARYLGPDRIRVNCVVPGWIMTERQKTLWLTPEADAELMRRQCIKEHVQPDDIARIVLWLSAADSVHCTNQSFVVDGGRL